ncbi:hypothetical protein AJ80_09802 [Polytolypa hystricis UAMH7299]|uniref:Aminoglycoside phosphotransferase domain-containing protein n=1 Tax=Polytolypa hystricis (strain UAMH7299) TaxID=1447883 RepID=A0A2B7WAQ0_POLH7|nr:hypothetical protein AJ80_09802 [Polytolypa hystricis UAMH7299]
MHDQPLKRARSPLLSRIPPQCSTSTIKAFSDVIDTNALIDLVHEVQGQLWVDKVNETYSTGRLCQWVSTFHPDKLPCQLDGMICDDYTDEKVAMEVTTLSLIRNRTTIPVPRVHAWGSAASKMDFINGLANFLLQLFKLEAQSPTPTRPLTFKAHSILQNGGVNTFGDQSHGFATTTEYFQYVVGQDWEQLVHQLNSTVADLRRSRLTDLIVQSREDLTVVGVVDLEWSYIGSAQLFGSAPWWLLQDRPVNSAWDYKGTSRPRLPPGTSNAWRFSYVSWRRKRQKNARGTKKRERALSSLVKWSQASGAMWLHMLLLSGFNDHRSFPFTQLRRHLGATEWAKREKEFDNEEELEAFAARKVSELDEYDEALEKREEGKALVDSGKMTKEEFVANALMEPGCPPCCSSFVGQ